MRRLPIIVLVLLALAIAAPGVLGLFAPALAMPHTPPQPIDALNETRALGGTRLAIAIALVYGAWSEARRRQALMLGLVVFGLTFLGRVLSSVLDGWPAAMAKPEIAEAVLVVLTLVALTAARRRVMAPAS